MTNVEFIRRIRTAVYDSAIDGTVTLLEQVPGRHPSSELVAMSQWYNQLPGSEKDRINEVIRLAVRGTVFGFLAVLDGARSIREPDEDVGSFELRYNLPGQSVLVNGPNDKFLHDLFNTEVPPT